MPASHFDNFDFNVEIKYTRRKGSIGLKIIDQGVRLLAPNNTPLKVLRELVEQRQPWIEHHLAELRMRSESTQAKPLLSGSEVYFRGDRYPLSIVDAERTLVELDSGYLCIDIPKGEGSHSLADTLADWYQQQAQEHLPARLHYWSELTGLSPNSIKVKSYKSRWGSCDHLRRITLNSRLMMAADAVIDYVIVHELCHLVEMNHSPAFWQLVGQYCPDYRSHRQWLRQQGRTLDLNNPVV